MYMFELVEQLCSKEIKQKKLFQYRQCMTNLDKLLQISTHSLSNEPTKIWNSLGQITGVGSHFPSPGESFQSRDQIQVSHIVGTFFTS